MMLRFRKQMNAVEQRTAIFKKIFLTIRKSMHKIVIICSMIGNNEKT